MDNLIAYFSSLPDPYNSIVPSVIIILIVASLFKLIFSAFAAKK